jgi:C-terminal processing protease CtpA/Prc
MKNESGRTVVQGFWEESPADRSGIQLNDEVLEINARGTKDLALREINEILDNDMIKTIELLIRGPQGEKKLALTKEMLFPEINNQY